MTTSFTDFRRTAGGLWRLWPYFRIPSRLVIVLFLATLLAAALEGVGVGLLIPMLELLRPETPSEPMPAIRTLMWMIPGQSSAFYTTLLCLLVAGSIIAKNVFIYISNRIVATMRSLALVHLRDRIFRRLQNAPLDLFEKSSSGEMANVLLLDTGRTAYSIEFLVFLCQRTLIALCYLVALLVISWQLSILAGLLAGVSGLLLGYTYKVLASSGRELSIAGEKVNTKLMEALGGTRLIRTTNSQERENQAFFSLNSYFTRVQKESMDATAALNPITESVGVVGGMTIVACAAIWLVQPGLMKAEMLLGFSFILLRLLPAIGMIYGLYGQTINLAGGVEQSEKWLTIAQFPQRPFGQKTFQRIERSIRLQELSYAYPNGALALDNVTLDIEAGRVTALVGGSGSGKSTLASVLLRLRCPSAGCVLVDGSDYWDFSPESWHRNVAVVDQECFLFQATLAENIRYGCQEATDEDVLRAIRQAHLEHVVAEMPDKEETMVGERGSTLSGGQRQRMSIARAMVRNPNFLILDEATSALDSVSETQVQAAIDEAQEGRTVLIIAHRFSTIRRAHKIVVMEGGRIVEEGSWEELEKRQGAFYRLLNASQKALV